MEILTYLTFQMIKGLGEKGYKMSPNFVVHQTFYSMFPKIDVFTALFKP